jgi:hypothetical protein
MQLLQEYGFKNMETTPFLDCVLNNNKGWNCMRSIDFKYFLQTLIYIGKSHLRLPITMDLYERGFSPKEIDRKREMWMRRQRDQWYTLFGAMVMDRRNLSSTGTLDYYHLNSVYKAFVCPYI